MLYRCKKCKIPFRWEISCSFFGGMPQKILEKTQKEANDYLVAWDKAFKKCLVCGGGLQEAAISEKTTWVDLEAK